DNLPATPQSRLLPYTTLFRSSGVVERHLIRDDDGEAVDTLQDFVRRRDSVDSAIPGFGKTVERNVAERRSVEKDDARRSVGHGRSEERRVGKEWRSRGGWHRQ